MEPDSDRSNINLSLKIAFVVLFLFFIGELVYLFYIVPNKKITTKVAPILTPTPTPTIIPTKAPTPVSATTSPAKQEFQGKIVELNTNIINPIPSFDIGFSFKLETNEDEIKKPITIFFNKNELSSIKVTDSLGKIILWQDLKVGQNIIVNLKKAEIKIF